MNSETTIKISKQDILDYLMAQNHLPGGRETTISYHDGLSHTSNDDIDLSFPETAFIAVTFSSLL